MLVVSRHRPREPLVANVLLGSVQEMDVHHLFSEGGEGDFNVNIWAGLAEGAAGRGGGQIGLAGGQRGRGNRWVGVRVGGRGGRRRGARSLSFAALSAVLLVFYSGGSSAFLFLLLLTCLLLHQRDQLSSID